MAQPFSFPEQLCNWLPSALFRWQLVHDPDFAWPILEIHDEQRQIMNVLTVPLTTWQQLHRHGLPDGLYAKLVSLRSDGIPAVALWEDYWIAKNSIVRSRLSAMLGISAKIPARLTQVRRIDDATTFHFLDINHLNGATSSKFRYGLFLPKQYYRVLPEDFAYDNSASEILVAVATFNNARIFEQHGLPFRSHELIRFASLQGTNVVGGLDKLLNAFIREKSPDDIMTYADFEWSDGRGYRRLGFEERGTVAPQKVYLDLNNMRRIRKRADDSSENTSIKYLTVFNLGSIKYVRLIKQRSSDAH
ncbi:hypothetical protein LZD49_02665 [Dyadobacter sp. CY261]|uniref:hypothetical protein n=1 Tax=Dyadobacter sp. CY261 TaxID=2907203 RepID=UPI001F19BA54|nr:hypothetical protein [Dyadobacter sp. CY261]MCF0069355.1 hypothetical protein [Dyadobacter sp. CY261]